MADRQKLFKDYRTERQSILQKRNDDREVRNEAKLRQLQQAETWQVTIVVILLLRTACRVIYCGYYIIII